MSKPASRTIVHPDGDSVAATTAARVITELIDRQSVKSPVHLVVTGGTVGTKTLAQIAASPAAAAIDWSGVQIWWGDERFLPEGDPERNETQARAVLLDSLKDALPNENIHFVPRPGDPGVETPEHAADLYAAQLAEFADPGELTPSFDVLLLGMGPDGHIASLFPGNPAVSATGSVTAVHDSPKPPPTRISLTFDAINRARNVWLVVAGEDKAEALASAWSDVPPDVTPAAHAHGNESTLWLVDVAATRDVP